MQLTARAFRRGIEITVEQINLRIGNGTTDRYALRRFPYPVSSRLVCGCDDAGFAGPISVDPTNSSRNQLGPGSKRLGGSLLASYDHQSHRGRYGLFQIGKLVDQFMPVSGWQVKYGYL